MHGQPPSLARPRCRPPMMMVACSMVVRRPPSAAVLCTAFVSCVVDLRRLLADRPGQHEDRHDERDHHKDDHAADHVPEDPAEGAGLSRLPAPGVRGSSVSPSPDQTVSQKSLTGFRLALTDVSRSGTVLVRSATAVTPPVTWRQGRQDRAQVEDDAQQSDRGDGDDQRGDDQGDPCGCRHVMSPFPANREASRPSRRT